MGYVCGEGYIYTCIHIPSSPYPHIQVYGHWGIFWKTPIEIIPTWFWSNSSLYNQWRMWLTPSKRSLKFTCLSYWGILQWSGRTWLLDIMMRGVNCSEDSSYFTGRDLFYLWGNYHSKAIADKYLSSLEFILEFLSPSSWLDLNYLG